MAEVTQRQVTHRHQGRSSSSVRAELIGDLDELSSSELSEIAADGHTFASLEWYHLLSRVNVNPWVGGEARPGFVLAREGETPIALCPLLMIRGPGSARCSLRRQYFEQWIEDLQRYRPKSTASFQRLVTIVGLYRRLLDWSGAPLDRCIIVGSPLALRNPWPISPSASSSRRAVYKAILRVLIQVARRQRSPLWFMGLAGEQSRLGEVLQQVGCHRVFVHHDNVIELEDYERFGDYLQSFRRPLRRALLRELRLCERSGVEFRFEDDLDHVAEDLAGSRQRQASPAVDRSFATAPDFWSSLSAAMGPKAEAIFAERGEEILGSHVLLRNERRGEMWSYRVMAMSPGGRDQRAAQNALAYYEPIRRTIALGYRRLWLGSGGYEAKAVRGARQVPIYSYFWFPRVWDRWLLPPYLQQFGEVTRHLIGLAIDRPTRIRAVLARSAKPTKEK